MQVVISFIGLLVMVAIAYGLSNNKKMVNFKTVCMGVILQLGLGVIILKTNVGSQIFSGARDIFSALLNFTNAGSDFIFGPLAKEQSLGFIFFTMVLPTIVFMSSLMSVLYHIGLMQLIVQGTAKVMMKVMGTSGAESLAAAANIFAGQTEAPLVIKPYISRMTESELMALMTGGMATVAGGVLAAYVKMGIDGGHLLAASVMSAPAALVCAKLLYPEDKSKVDLGPQEIMIEKTSINIIDAAASGAGEGVKLAINVGGMLLAFVALVAMANGILGTVGHWVGMEQLSLELIFGKMFWPVAYIMGVPSQDCEILGALLGKKLILNEFVAYVDLKNQLSILSPRSVTIATYALCGFANFSSVAIQVGGIGVLAPDRRQDLAKLGIRSLVGGTLACLMTACIAGMLIP